MIIICCGPPCSGKSFIAEHASRSLDVECISVDPLLTELIPDSDRNVNDRTVAIEEMHRRARAIAERGGTVILDSTYTRQKARRQLVDACGAFPIAIVECFVTPEVAVDRFRRRADHDAIDLTEESVRKAASEFPWSNVPGVVRNVPEVFEPVGNVSAWVAEGL